MHFEQPPLPAWRMAFDDLSATCPRGCGFRSKNLPNNVRIQGLGFRAFKKEPSFARTASIRPLAKHVRNKVKTLPGNAPIATGGPNYKRCAICRPSCEGLLANKTINIQGQNTEDIGLGNHRMMFGLSGCKVLGVGSHQNEQ